MNTLDELLAGIVTHPQESSQPIQSSRLSQVVIEEPLSADENLHVEESPSNSLENNSDTIQTEEQEEPISLDDTDFNDILQEAGFEESTEEDEDDDWEENEERGEGEEEVNTDETNSDYNGYHVPVTYEQVEETSIQAEEVEEQVEPDDEGQEEQEEITQEEDNGQIPSNSPTLLVDNSTSRFSGTEWYNEIQKARIILAGVGGIGSNAVFQLARMAPEALYLYDDDRVESSNMSGQLYSFSDIGKFKVDAMASMINNYTTMSNAVAIPEQFTSFTEPGPIMICGFDNMMARRIFFNSWIRHIQSLEPEERKNCLFLDGRLSIDTLQVFAITGDDEYNQDLYFKEYLFSDARADETICSMKQTTYLACMIGSIIVNLFTNFIANQLNPIIPYDLPFFTEYDAQNMIFKTQH